VRKSTGIAVALATTLSLAMGILFVVFAEPLCGLITNSPEVIAIAKERMILLCLTFFLTSIMEILSASLTALGFYKNNLFVGFLIGLCTRAAYVFFIWPSLGSLGTLYAVVPITSLMASLEYIIVLRKRAIPRLEQRIAAGEDLARAK
jgi:Na+-driven multidrug efflux pump